MLKFLKIATAAATIALFASPAAAQDEPEEARTTYRVVFLDLNPGADDRWTEIMEEHVIPARRTAGLPLPTVHWVMAGGDYDLMIVTEMPDGLADLDTHGSPGDAPVMAALRAQLGSDAAVEALGEERRGLEGNSMVVYSHTHP